MTPFEADYLILISLHVYFFLSSSGLVVASQLMRQYVRVLQLYSDRVQTRSGDSWL